MSLEAGPTTTWDELLTMLLDVAGETVAAHSSGWVVRGRVTRTDVVDQDGGRRAALRIGEDAAVVIHEDGLIACRWDSRRKRESLAVVDGHGARELTIELEPER
jgi:hypothetical protein